MTNNLKKLVLNGQEYSIPQGTTYTAGENIDISSGVISATNAYMITDSDVTITTDDTKGVAPYNTSYGYTNIEISANAGIKWIEGAIYSFVCNSRWVVSDNRNARMRIGSSGDWIPVFGSSTSILGAHSYFVATQTRLFVYKTTNSTPALHMINDTTYSALTVANITSKNTTARVVSGSIFNQGVAALAVGLTGNQTVAGTKTFSTSPVVPSKTSAATNTGTAIATEAQVYKKQDTLVSGTNIKTINNESLLGSGNITIESGPTYSAGKNVSISSNTINSDSTSILTQSDYDNLPSSKNSDDKTYFICEATLLTYAEIVSMATDEGEPRTNTRAELNKAPVDYYNMLSSGGNLTSVTLSTPSGSFPTISGISEKVGTVRYIAYRNGTWIEGEKHDK